MTKTVGMVSLGCDKNRVDGEKILYTLSEAGYRIVPLPEEADVIIINTCSFIQSAKQESIDTILEFAEYKTQNKKLIVTGCFAERYGKEAEALLPEVDAFLGIDCYKNIVDIIENGSKERVVSDKDTSYCGAGRIVSTPGHYAYLKIADGCDNFCSYCAIPYIRGRYRSYPMDKLIDEAKNLLDDNIKELIVIAQDTTKYGIDLYGKYMLPELLRELCKLDFVKIRLLYAYPELLSDEIINIIATEPKMCKYIDIPLQHIDDDILAKMNRKSRKNEIMDILHKIKTANKDIVIRSSFIVGFPGETDEQFNNLKEFIKTGIIDYAGFFEYSQEEGTLAYKMEGQVLQRVKSARAKELNAIQSGNIIKNHEKLVGKTLEVIYEGIDYRHRCFFGRTEFDAPEIDTLVYFTSNTPLDIGKIYPVTITDGGFHLSGAVKE